MFLAQLSAQTAARIEALLNESAICWDTAAAFVLEAAGYAVFSDSQEAFKFAMSRNWLPKESKPGEAARLNGVALLVMQAFDLKGGIGYSIAKNPHYAYRELTYQKIIQGRTDPQMTVSGNDFLYILGRVLSLVGDSPAISPAGIVEEQAEKAKLHEIAGMLKAIPERPILVTGHTALAGSRDDQLLTSWERAQSVAVYLVEPGVRDMNHITVHGYGAEWPIAGGRTPAGMAANRRVEIVIADN